MGKKIGTFSKIDAQMTKTFKDHIDDGIKITIDVMPDTDGIRIYLDDPTQQSRTPNKKPSTLLILDTDNAKWLSQKILDVLEGVARPYEG